MLFVFRPAPHFPSAYHLPMAPFHAQMMPIYPAKVRKAAKQRPRSRYCPSMVPSPAFRLRRRGTWALSEPSAVLLWQAGLAWSSVAALVDASTGRRIVLSGFVLAGPVCVA